MTFVPAFCPHATRSLFILRRGRLRRPQSLPDGCNSHRRWRSNHQYVTEFEEESSAEVQPLIQMAQATLGYPDTSKASWTPPINLTIDPPAKGGHALLGKNGCGKTLITQTIVHRGSTPHYLKRGSFQTANPWHSRATAHVSFASHQQLLDEGGTASKAISEGGKLNKAAQFLVVRFGLFPLLQRDVTY